MFICDQRVMCAHSRSKEFIGKKGTVIEDSGHKGHTQEGIPVSTTYVRFDVPLLSQEGFTTTDIELPTKNLKEIFE